MITEPVITHEFRSHKFQFISTFTAPTLIAEIFRDNYEVLGQNIEFRPDDVILDIGACEGMFSIFMSVLFPFTRIIAFEPVPITYSNFLKNIELNGCKNIVPYNLGIGKPGQSTVTLVTNKCGESGGSTSLCTFNPEIHETIKVNLTSLDTVFEMCNIDRCRLLKIDIEGMEYDVFYPSTVLPRVDYLAGEFHINRKLDFESRRIDGLAVWVSNQTQLIHCDMIRMAE